MKRSCRTCHYYSPEYQGYGVEFVNYCCKSKKHTELESCCGYWYAAPASEMKLRQKIWQLWNILERRVQS